MKPVLLCPSDRKCLPALVRQQPVAVIPIMGACLLEYWMAHLADQGCREVTIVASDRPKVVKAIVGNGERWGIVAAISEVDPTCSETAESDWRERTTLLNHLPGKPEKPLLNSYSSWFAGVVDWLPHAKTPDRVGMKQLQPGVWIGYGARISSKAELRAPCWIGENVIVGRHSVIGPETILENGCLVEDHCEITQSHIGETSYISPYAELRQSIVLGGILVNWASSSELPLLDPLLVSSLKRGAWRVPTEPPQTMGA